MPKQDLGSLLNSDEVIILMRKVDNKQVDFKVAISGEPLTDKDDERGMQGLFCMAVGLIGEAKNNPLKLMADGASISASVLGVDLSNEKADN